MFCKKCRVEQAVGVSGQGFTRFTCEKCGQISLWHNTNTPKYCVNCVENEMICGYCGASIAVEILESLLEGCDVECLAEEINISEKALRKFLKTSEAGPRNKAKILDFAREHKYNVR